MSVYKETNPLSGSTINKHFSKTDCGHFIDEDVVCARVCVCVCVCVCVRMPAGMCVKY